MIASLPSILFICPLPVIVMATAEVSCQTASGAIKRLSGKIEVHSGTIYIDGKRLRKCVKGDKFVQNGDCEANP